LFGFGFARESRADREKESGIKQFVHRFFEAKLMAKTYRGKFSEFFEVKFNGNLVFLSETTD
jgi:hypothetical protein